MWMDSINNTGGINKSPSSANKANEQGAMNKDTFLRLLITELQNQNPLEPMNNQDFVNQMVQFQNMEQMTNMSQSLQDYLGTLHATTKLQASSVVGKYVVIEGNEVTLSGGLADSVLYSMEAEGNVMIKIKDEDGQVVRTESIGYKDAGIQSYRWDGKNDYGAVLPDGTYSYQLSTIDESGNQQEFGGVIGGIVQAVQYVDDEIYVILNGEKYNYEKIIEVSAVEASEEEEEPTEEA